MRFNVLLRAFLPAIFFIALFESSCKKEDSILGLELQPNSETLGLIQTDTFTLETYTVLSDSIRSDEQALSLVGSMNDAIFGKSEASFYSHIRLPNENVKFGTSALCDSIVLYLDYSGYYGNLNPQSFKVFEVLENFDISSTYYSNTILQTNILELGKNENHTPVVTGDSIQIGQEKYPTHLRIKLEDIFGQRLLSLDSTTLQNNTNFINYFKGIYVVTDNPSQLAGEGAVLYFDLSSKFSTLRLYYTENGTSKKFDFGINQSGSAARINKFSHDYSGTQIADQIADPNLGENTLYVQSMAGVKTKIKIPHIKTLTNSGKKVAINKAEIIVPISNLDASLLPHAALNIVASDELGNNIQPKDQTDISRPVQSTITNSEYKFNLPRHVHYLLYGNMPDYGLFIVPSGNSINGNRTILGGGYPTGTMKLKITYTEL